MTGTRFRLFPNADEGYAQPELVIVSSPAGSLGPGPSDPTMRAILPLDKQAEYDPPRYMPPYEGPCLPPAFPDANGNFDHIAVDNPAFLCAHLFGTIRWTLDIWEYYLGNAIVWWHYPAYPQLELIPILNWDNAHSGPGFIETGSRLNRDGVRNLFCLNFDVVSHESGHAILFSQVGVPTPENIHSQFLAFHESFSDLIALVSALHFPSVVAKLFAQTGGNLYVLNLVSRIGELSDVEQIRIADNETTMEDVAGLRVGLDGDWIDPLDQDRNAHSLAQPLTGAMWDILVEVFQDRLVASGGLPPTLDTRGWSQAEVEGALAAVQTASRARLEAFHDAFHGALDEARDLLGFAMAHVMHTLRAEDVSFDSVSGAVIDAFLQRGYQHQLDDLLEIFALRGINPVPSLLLVRPSLSKEWSRLSYVERARRVQAAERSRRGDNACRCGFGAFVFAKSLINHPHRAQPRADW
jgi:hypothetical protein